MNTSLEVLFAPAEFEALKDRNLAETVCVVFDILRATSSMVVALASGAESIIPVAEIEEALRLRRMRPEVLLAGERDGVRIQGRLTGGIEFDLGNSPREFTPKAVAGRTIVMTTTNGTRALRACARAAGVLICSFLNLGATARFIARKNPARLLLVCGGTLDQAAYEDILGAGALCELLWPGYEEGAVADSALVCRQLFESARANLLSAVSQSRNARRLLACSDLVEDVPFCLGRDPFDVAAGQAADGAIRRSAPGGVEFKS